MRTQAGKAELFLSLHHGPEPLLLPNPWDVGSAKLLASLGFAALATTSGGFAATLGRLDGSVTRDEAISHAAALAAATDLPVSAGVRRVSVGSAFAFAALGAVAEAAHELREQGTYGFLDRAAAGRCAARAAFTT